MYFDFECDDNESTDYDSNHTLTTGSPVGHINTTSTCSFDSLYSAVIHNGTMPTAPGYNGYLEKWYSDDACANQLGWSFIAENKCVNDEANMFYWTSNPGILQCECMCVCDYVHAWIFQNR